MLYGTKKKRCKLHNPTSYSITQYSGYGSPLKICADGLVSTNPLNAVQPTILDYVLVYPKKIRDATENEWHNRTNCR